MRGQGWRDAEIETPDGLRLHYRDYDAATGAAVPAICLPGLTRTARDFGPLAAHLAQRRRVICPDMRGRGKSQFDEDPANYNIVVECGDILRLMDDAGAPRAVFVGASRGGLQAMVIAQMSAGRIAGTVLNDVGPRLERAGLARIVADMQSEPRGLTSWGAAVERLKRLNGALFTGLDDIDWAAFAGRLYSDLDGKPVRDYDPALTLATAAALEGELPELWPQFEALGGAPVLALRGEHSDVLSRETLEEMRRRMPAMRAVEVPGRGHTPILDEPVAVEAVDALLAEVDAAA